jgi:hypothetical protein
MRYESRYIDDVDRPVAHDLVGDVDPASAAGVPDVSTARHDYLRTKGNPLTGIVW